jgi:hypothetical protein
MAKLIKKFGHPHKTKDLVKTGERLIALINRPRGDTLSHSIALGHRLSLLPLKPKEPKADAPSLLVGSFSRRCR